MNPSTNKLVTVLIDAIRRTVNRNPLVSWAAVVVVAVIFLAQLISFLPRTLALCLIIAIFAQLKGEWQRGGAARTPVDRVRFPIFCGIGIALVVLSLFVSHVFPASQADTVVIEALLAVGATIFFFMTLWMARLYWDATTRLAVLEQIVKDKLSADPGQWRRAYVAGLSWEPTPMQSYMFEQIAPDDLVAPPQTQAPLAEAAEATIA
jgi:hypothetical protein